MQIGTATGIWKVQENCIELFSVDKCIVKDPYCLKKKSTIVCYTVPYTWDPNFLRSRITAWKKHIMNTTELQRNGYNEVSEFKK